MLQYIKQTYRRVQLEIGKISLGRLLIIMVNSAHNGTPDDDQLINTVTACVLEQRQTSNELTTNRLRTIIVTGLLYTPVSCTLNVTKLPVTTNKISTQH